MGRKNKQRMKAQKDTHHVIPKSQGGTTDTYNCVTINKHLHTLYHRLFKNRTPDEIIVFLVRYFWNGQTQWLRKALKELE